MTLEELLDCDSTKLQSLTDSELLTHFQQYLTVTRPEMSSRPKQQVAPINLERQAKIAQLQKLGIDIDLGMLKKKKK
jgi:hypothetical protein